MLFVYLFHKLNCDGAFFNEFVSLYIVIVCFLFFF